MSHSRPVLIGILAKNPSAENPVVTHALHLANAMDADIHLFLSVYAPGYAKLLHEQNDKDKAAEAHVVVSARAQLEQCADFLRARKLNTTTTLNWNKPDEDALTIEIDKTKPILLICQRPAATWLTKLPLPDPAWNLSKLSDSPVLFVNNQPRSEPPGAVWAAVDIAKSQADTEALNNQIISQAKLLASYLGAPTHLVHCYSSAAELAEIAIGLSSTDYVPAQEVLEANRDRHYTELCALADVHGISREHIHNLPGVAQVVLPLLAARQRPGYIVAGAHNRGRLSRFFHGSTTKKLLHRTDGGLCVVRVPDSARKNIDVLAS